MASFAGKVFPIIKRKGLLNGDNTVATLTSTLVENNGNEEEILDDASVSSDYVFRIITAVGDDFEFEHHAGT